MSRVILDISRLISRIRHATPSGVDRVEMAYARGLSKRYGADLAFAAVHPSGLYGRIRVEAAQAYLDELERRWSGDRARATSALPETLRWLRALLPSRRGVGRDEAAVYVQASPHHLTDEARVRRILAQERAAFACLVHDLIPVTHPEYARPNGAGLHARRLATVARLADAVIANSAATATAYRAWVLQQTMTDEIAPRDGQAITVALLGTEPVLSAAAAQMPDGRPFFLCLGTIEPRKNHLLLLNLWRQMAETLSPDSIPRLVIVGRRGWENEQVIDMLERCPGIQDHVTELNGCADARLAGLLRGAQALLMPSFAEGYGMPVAEALSVGTPVICSDLPALREVGGAAPDYLDPLDGPGWRQAILDCASRGPGYRAHVVRLAQWRAPDWRAHMDVVGQVIADCAAVQASARQG